MYAYLRRQAGPDLAEQVLSDVFLAVWRRWDSQDVPSLPWLLRTAHNALRTQRRAQRRRDRLTAAVIFDTSLAVAVSAEAEALRQRSTVAALRQLDQLDREALLLVAWDGLDYGQAAAVLGITRTAFATRLSRARRRLETALDADIFEPDPASKGASA